MVKKLNEAALASMEQRDIIRFVARQQMRRILNEVEYIAQQELDRCVSQGLLYKIELVDAQEWLRDALKVYLELSEGETSEES